jgi:putative transcriptional regulator
LARRLHFVLIRQLGTANLAVLFFLLDRNMNESLTGNLLVASSLAENPICVQSVCLVVHQDDVNVIGVMLNRPINPSPAALLQLLDQKADPQPKNRLSPHLDQPATQSPSTADDPAAAGSTAANSVVSQLHFGGPRSGPVVAIHQTSEFAEAETGKGIYVAAQKQHLEDLVRDHPAPYRLIVGHLGWELPDLVTELENGLWHVVPATTEIVFCAANEMWPRLIRRATSSSVAKWIGVPDVVGAAELN